MKNRWKKPVLLLAALLLILSACSSNEPISVTPSDSGSDKASRSDNQSSLAVRLAVPEHVTGEFSSESGITRITVDADIIVPDVSQADLIEALPRVFEKDEINKLIHALEDDYGWYDGYSPEGPYNDEGLVQQQAVKDNVYYNLMVLNENQDILGEQTIYQYMDAHPDYIYSIITAYYMENAETHEIGAGPYFDFVRSNTGYVNSYAAKRLDGPTAKDCTISIEAAQKTADGFVHELFPDYQLQFYGVSAMGHQEYAVTKEEYYIFRYTREINGIPVNDSENKMSGADGDAYGHAAGQGSLVVTVADDGIRSVQYMSPLETGKILQEDISLLSFADIWDIFSNLALLSFQHLEIEPDVKQNYLNVHEIRFGYMSVIQPDRSYVLTPVWDFYGTRVLHGDGGYAGINSFDVGNEGESFFTINAIDGTVIDRYLGY